MPLSIKENSLKTLAVHFGNEVKIEYAMQNPKYIFQLPISTIEYKSMEV